MSELEIQKWLRSGRTVEELKTTYGIGHKRHSTYPNLVLFKYNQIASPFGEQIVRECRGIIIDESDGWTVIARGFDKFFNYGEGHAAPIDWPTAKVQEKIDGSLCLLYSYDARWHVATTGTPDACGDVNGTGVTFYDYFWGTVERMGLRLPACDREACFMLELTGPLNRVVVPHMEPRLTALGMRHRTTGQYDSAWLAGQMLHVPSVRDFPLQSIADIERSFADMSPLKQEGYVIVDAAFNRIKVKHPGYVALHHAKDGMSTKAFVEIARSGEVPECIAAFPELKPMLEEARSRLFAAVDAIERDYATLPVGGTQKDFALLATKKATPAAMFAIRAGKTESARAWIAAQPIDKAVALLGYKDEVKGIDGNVDLVFG